MQAPARENLQESSENKQVLGNLVREIGIWQKQSSMWFQVAGNHMKPRLQSSQGFCPNSCNHCGIATSCQAVAAESQILENVHFNGPRAGINFNDGFGGGDLIEGVL